MLVSRERKVGDRVFSEVHVPILRNIPGERVRDGEERVENSGMTVRLKLAECFWNATDKQLYMLQSYIYIYMYVCM